MGSLEFLVQLCDAPGVSGHEDAVRELIKDHVSSYADSVYTDHLGNLYIQKGEQKPGPHVMFAAHTDEVGLMVERIDEQGFVSFFRVGGIDPRALPAKRVRLGREGIPGVIGMKPSHLQQKEEKDKVVGVKDLRIDIGATSASQASSHAEPGTPVWFDTRFEARGNILKGKAFDDRAGCFMMAELLRGDFSFPATFVWTVQEEVGLRGARIAAARVKPDVLVILEGTGAADVPTPGDKPRNPMLGKGPVMTILDRSVVANRRLLEHFTKTADELRIPFQYKRPLVGGTDAGAAVRVFPMQAVILAIPARYIHSPVAFADYQDIINTIMLVREALMRLAGK